MRAVEFQHRRLRLAWAATGLALVMLGEASVAEGQALVAEPARLDLGAGHISETLTGRLRLHNRSSESVKIYSVETSCDSCTEVASFDDWIEPGEVGEVEVSMHCTSGRDSRLTQTVTVSSSDRTRPKLKVVIEGDFQRSIVIPRPRIDLGEIGAGSSVMVPVRVLNWSDEPVVLARSEQDGSVDGSAGGGAHIVPARKAYDPGQLEFTAKLHIPARPGRVRLRMHWSTGLSTQPVVELEAWASAVSDTTTMQHLWIPTVGGLGINFNQWLPTSSPGATSESDLTSRVATPPCFEACDETPD